MPGSSRTTPVVNHPAAEASAPILRQAGSSVAGCPKTGAEHVNACSAAVDELKASRLLIDALETENAALSERLSTEKQINALLAELNETHKNETEALRTAVAAKNETIAAKDAVINTQDKLIETLKHKKRSPLARITDILIGAAVFAVFR